MAIYTVKTPQRTYDAVVERGVLSRAGSFVPPGAGRLFVVTTADVWEKHGAMLKASLEGRSFEVLYFPGGEERKRLAEVETLAEAMIRGGGDRTSLVIAFGGGIVNDLGGFLAAIFMRGIPVLQVPTTLLSQVDAGVGGKTGVNLLSGKNLLGAFHQPVAALIDPDVLSTLPEREYRAGLYEVIKCGIIRSPRLFNVLTAKSTEVLARARDVVNEIIGESVRIKAEVVSQDEREGDLRRILNFGHTFGHTLEAETAYARFLHGEAVGVGMCAAALLAGICGYIPASVRDEILRTLSLYGPIPPLDGISAEALVARMASDKKTMQGRVHFVLPVAIGQTKIVSGIDEKMVLRAVQAALA